MVELPNKDKTNIEVTVNTKNTEDLVRTLMNIENTVKKHEDSLQQKESEIFKLREELADKESKLNHYEKSSNTGSGISLSQSGQASSNEGITQNQGFNQTFSSHSEMLDFLYSKKNQGTNAERSQASEIINKLWVKNTDAIKKSNSKVIFEDDFSSINPENNQRESLIKRTLRLQDEAIRKKVV